MKWENLDNIKFNNSYRESTILTNQFDNENIAPCNSCNQIDNLPQTVRQNCCCKKSMIEALKLLCNTELSDLIDFEKFAFLTDTFIVGARLVLLKLGTEEKDNLSNLDGKFKRFSPCNCDLIDIEGTAVYNVPLPVSVTDLLEQLTEFIKLIIDLLETQGGVFGAIVAVLKAILDLLAVEDLGEQILQAILDFIIKFFTTLPMVDTASLCAIESIAFQVKYVESTSDDKTRDELTEENYQKAKYILQNQLDKNTKNKCGECSCNCNCDDCCCTDSILNELFSSNLSRKVSLAAGNLTLREATILGVKGDVLVLANDKKRRFYFVCANSVKFLE